MIKRAMMATVFAAAGLVAIAQAARGAGGFMEEAPEFPPGAFSDGGKYQISDFSGKVVVLFFYESACPSCRAMVPERNAFMAKYKDKPVKFIAIEAHDSAAMAAEYIRGTRLAYPVFADPLRIMEKRYGLSISLQNIYQFRIIDGSGKIVSFVDDGLDKVVAETKWKYKDKGYDAALAKAIDLLEWNQFEAGMKLVNPLRKSLNKATAASAEKLFEEVKKEGTAWKEAAEKAADKPVAAYDLYVKIAAVFVGDELGKDADEKLKKLKVDDAVKKELAARAEFLQLNAAMAKATPTDHGQVLAFLKKFETKHAGTPTAEKAGKLSAEIVLTSGLK
jgi:thiol-disulfide isomerase/thioredoxin